MYLPWRLCPHVSSTPMSAPRMCHSASHWCWSWLRDDIFRNILLWCFSYLAWSYAAFKEVVNDWSTSIGLKFSIVRSLVSLLQMLFQEMCDSCVSWTFVSSIFVFWKYFHFSDVVYSARTGTSNVFWLFICILPQHKNVALFFCK